MDSSSERGAADRPEISSNQVRTINLALQGGGAHGAFTWGVLDRLLDEKELAFEGLSATSAGAMNAAAFAYGLAVDGREGARKALTDYWKRVSEAARRGPLAANTCRSHAGRSQAVVVADLLHDRLRDAHAVALSVQPRELQTLCAMWSSNRSISACCKRPDCPVKLFLSATNVRTGKVKIFSGKEISVDAVMASACLPTMFHAVEIDGEAYWDGGYMG